MDEFIFNCNFFYGASKGNLGVSGTGGLVISSNGLSSIRFCWGLDIMSNNQAEFYSLLQASQLAKNKGYKSVQIFSDYEMLIKALNSSDSLKKFALIVTMQRIKRVLKSFDKADSYHILQGLNTSMDALANQACHISQGFLSINGEPNYFYPIP